MKQQIRHTFVLGLMLLAALVSVVPHYVFAASSNTMYITPTPRSATTNDVFTVSVDGHVTDSFVFGVGVGVHTASGTITFPSNILSVVSTNANGTTFGASKSIVPGTGQITFDLSSGYNSAATYQDVHLFTITFKAKAAGDAGVNFSSASYGNTSGAGVITPATTGGKYTISDPPPPAQPSSPGNPTTPSTPTTPSSPRTTPRVTTPVNTPATDPTPEDTPPPVIESDGGLKIENVKITATRQTNTIAWTLNNPEANPTLTVGTSKGDQKDTDVTKQSDGSYLANLSSLKLGTLYYFTIKAATSDNLQGATYSGTFTTRGYPVQLTVKQNNLLVPGAKVQIGQRNFVANKNSIITTELGDGTYTASITPPDSSSPQDATFTVAKKTIPSSGSPDLQSFVLNITTENSSTAPSSAFLIPIVSIVVVFIATIGGVVGFMLYRRRQQAVSSGTGTDADLLASSYGTAAVENLANTPQANLEVQDQASAMPIEQPYSDADPQPVDETAYAQQPTMDSTQFDPSGLPLPPADPTYVAQDTADAEILNTEYSEDEQLSPELTQVEASSDIEDEEPSAVYDASTGELDIIHHHTAASTATPDEPQQDLDVATADSAQATDTEVYTVAGAQLPPVVADDSTAATEDTYSDAPSEETEPTNSPQPPLTVPQ